MVLLPKGLSSGESLVEHETQAVDIALLGDFFARPLLRRHVGLRTTLDVLGLDGSHDCGKTEVGEAGLAALVDHHVRRFQVAMKDALIVSGG